jgi:hypothetical protein
MCATTTTESAEGFTLLRDCVVEDLDQAEISIPEIRRGIEVNLSTSVRNISGSACAISCRANPVAARIVDRKGRIVADVTPGAADGCPPDQNTDDGVEHWEIKSGARYRQAMTWQQGACGLGLKCPPVAAGAYRVLVDWSIGGDTRTVSRSLAMPKGRACPLNATQNETLIPVCVGVTKQPKIPRPNPPTTVAR